MVEHLKKLLHRVDFSPFDIVTTDGHVFRILTRDHAHVAPGGWRVVVWDDKGSQDNVSVRHIVRIVESLPEPGS